MQSMEQEIMQTLKRYSEIQTNLASTAARQEITKTIMSIIVEHVGKQIK